MYKIYASVKKEVLLLINDKIGLILMFAMPLLLVIIITVIQDAAFKIVNNNQISLLISNHDSGEQGEQLANMLIESGMFEVAMDNELDSNQLNEKITGSNYLTGIYIADGFSKKMTDYSSNISKLMLKDFGLSEGASSVVRLPSLIFVHDPVLQDNFCRSIMGIIYAHLGNIESSCMIESIYQQMGNESPPVETKEMLSENRTKIRRVIASQNGQMPIPNATQHNVPAWTIFAMFFMVVSLGSSIVKERNSGSFMRIKTLPVSLSLVYGCKQFVYMLVGLIQIALIFSVGVYVFPLMGLPKLVMPGNYVGILIMALISGYIAVSYSLLIGAYARTQEQANGVGAISIIIMAAIGGIWVPSFVMPDYMQLIGKLSPLYWCLEGFYTLFLRNGNWYSLMIVIMVLLSSSILFQILAHIKFKKDKII